MRSRPLGVRVYVLLAMITVVVVSVGLTGLLTYKAVAAELKHGDPQLSAKLLGCIMRAVVEAGLASSALALLLAVPISLRVARPLRRLNDLADRIVATGASIPRVAIGGGREIGELGATLERLAASLRRQDEVRRATAADVTHELRGSLGAIQGYVEAVQDGLIEREIGLRQIADDAKRMGRVLDDLRSLVEAQRPAGLMSKEPVDLAALVRRRAAACAQRFRAASLALQLDAHEERVDGDAARLEQVVDNLLLNALRYTDPGGVVRVSVRGTGHEAVIEVADSGIGISPEHLTRVFDRFWRSPEATERAGHGSGVGLAVVRDLVLAHHGRVEVQSTVGMGSRFSVRLPHDAQVTAGEPPVALDLPGVGESLEPAVVKLRGDIDVINAAEIQSALLRRIWATSGDLKLDLSEVGLFGSTAISILASAEAEIRARGGRIVIIAAPAGVTRLLQMVGVPRRSSGREGFSHELGQRDIASLTPSA